MAKLNIRNRNKDKYFKDGKPKPPNWEYRFEGAKVNGKRNQISEAGFRTKKEAEVAGTKALATYNNAGQHFVPAEISVADFFDYWLKNYSGVNNSDNTTASYDAIINNHIKPRLGIYKLKSIDTLTVQEFINAMHTEMGFSKTYIKSILKVLKNGFKYAHKTAKFISSNPVEDVTLPITGVDEDEDILVLTKEQVATILDRFRRSPYQYYAMLIAYYTGLRVSEVYGLTWDRIDFEKKTLKVDRIAKKFEYNGKGKQSKGISGQSNVIWYLGECKTKSSYRTISIGDTLINALMDYKEMQEANKKEYGSNYTRTYAVEELTKNKRKVLRIIQTTEKQKGMEELHLVCVKEDGSFTGTNSMKYPSKVINDKMGIEFKFHAFRHTHATMLIEQGLPIKAVSERLGHASTKITWDIYVKVTKKMEDEVVETFEAESGLNFRDEELYALWKLTLNKPNIAYYKKRNITVCEEWQDFAEFEKWANDSGWASGLKLLRIDKAGHYEPNNCMFGTESKSVKGQYVYSDGVNMKSYSVRKIGRGWQYRINDYDEAGKRIEITKAGFPTENDAALAAEAIICEMLATQTLHSDRVELKLVQ